MPVVQRRDRRGIELSEDSLEFRCGGVRIDDLPWHGVDALRRQRTHENVPIAIQDAAATRKNFDRIRALRKRLPAIERALEALNVAEPPCEKERDDHARVEKESRTHRSDACEGSLMHACAGRYCG